MWVFELVRVFICIEGQYAVSANKYYVTLSTAPGITLNWDPRCFAHHDTTIDYRVAGPMVIHPGTIEINFDDGNGKGILIGSDNIYCYFNTANTVSASNYASIKFEYRHRLVSATEYIGIVQSQQ